MSKKPSKTYYYKDELNDDFSGISRNTKTIDENFRYNKNAIWEFFAFIVYWVIMIPIAFVSLKIKFGLKIENKKILKRYRKQGFFLYGNHTQAPGDGFIQALVSFPKKSYVLVHADNVSAKGTEQFMMMVGALPLPTTYKGYRNFLAALEERVNKGRSIVVYPEAHIWPYYTGIRNFSQTSFKYPVKYNKPAFTFTVIYKKRRLRKTPKIIVKVDGPFIADYNLSTKDAEKKLRDEIYQAMQERASESNHEHIKYIHLPEDSNKE